MATAAALAAAAVVSGAPAAAADNSGQADAKARQILAQVQQIQRQVAKAESAYDQALAGVGASVNTEILDGQASDAIAAAARAARDRLDDRVRGLYMTGGPIAIYASLLDSADPAAFEEQAMVIAHVVRSQTAVVAAATAVSREAAKVADSAQQRVHARIRTERSVAAVATRVATLLAEEQALLDTARQHAADVHAAEQALLAQQQAMSTITADRIAALRPLPADPAYMALYHQAAAAECPGLSWTVLAAIGQIESGHGRDTSTSYAGAVGPMQFLPETFASFAVDGDNDGFTDITNPADAIFTAAHYLCSNGANRGAGALYRAIWHYNHADWYVQMVLTLAQRYAG